MVPPFLLSFTFVFFLVLFFGGKKKKKLFWFVLFWMAVWTNGACVVGRGRQLKYGVLLCSLLLYI